MSYWVHGIEVLKSVASSDALSALSKLECKNIASQNLLIDEDLNSLILNKKSYLTLPDYIPRDKNIAKKWRECFGGFFGKGIQPFINDIPQDPHSQYDLANLHFLVNDLGFDPSCAITTLSINIETLILCGCGDGDAVRQLINYFKPKNLIILVADWKDWASSFFSVNWVEVWNQYVQQDDSYILALSSPSPKAVLGHLLASAGLSLDHAFIYESPVATKDTKDIAVNLRDHLLDRALAYMGFSMDEYNMIWNSWKILERQPLMYTIPPKICNNLDFLVVGSGPSLDDALPWIRKNQDKFVIVSCASNFGTLKKADIDVDFLCLLERGEFMVDQYRQVVESCGSHGTRLLASVTTPAEIHDFFNQSMVYFRPMLTPFCIFADNQDQVLSMEGPQTINTGAALAMHLGARRIILCGVDLGTKSLDKVRTNGAIGNSPRTFDKKVRGNLTPTVYTNDLLIDALMVLEAMPMIKHQDTKLVNCSDGVLIDGWQPQEFNNLKLADKVKDMSCIDSWWNRQNHYSADSFHANFESSKPRSMLASYKNQLNECFASASLSNWSITRRRVADIMNISQLSKHQQFLPRIIRGYIYRLMTAIHRQLLIFDSTEIGLQEQFLKQSMDIMITRLNDFEIEILDLLDSLDL